MNPSFLQSLNNVSAEEMAERIQGVMRNVYLWMALGLLATAFTSAVVGFSPALLRVVDQFWWAFLLVEFGLVLGLSFGLSRMSVPVALGGFFLYAIVNGATLTLVVMAYTTASVLSAFLATACLFGAMTIIGYTTKMDLTQIGGFLLMALLGVIIGSIVNLFFANTVLDWILTFVGIIIFIGLTAYDTQRIKNMAMASVTSGDVAVAGRVSVIGALILYLDFINLFLRILRLFGKRR